MSYTALYRKYRPREFKDVIGQEHITRTLINQINSDRVGHAYLFTGSRGTGKTTCAKIFARAINCTNPVNGSPCFKCAACSALEDAAAMDILEIDAASNNKVDEVREIRERVKYPPVFGKYKVYIIDEVHMLTDSAFNALLKTLEEPPSHAIFILATTEVHKLPATILSRCMRFDFRLVSQDTLTLHIKGVYDREGKKYEEDAVRYIAQAGEGSVRDALSVADMCLSRSDGKLTLADVQDVLGAADKRSIFGLFASIAEQDVARVLNEIDNLANLGKSMSMVAKDLVFFARNVLAIKTGCEKLVIDTRENIENLTALSQRYSIEMLVSLIQILSSADMELRYAVSPKIILESVCLRACNLLSSDFNALQERLERVERGMAKALTLVSELCDGGEFKKNITSSNSSNAVSAGEKPNDAASVWGRMTTYFRTNQSMQLYSLFGNHRNYKIEGAHLVVFASDALFLQFSDEEVIAEANRALAADGQPLTLKVEKATNGYDIDKEIERIKKLVGDKVPVNIK